MTQSDKANPCDEIYIDGSALTNISSATIDSMAVSNVSISGIASTDYYINSSDFRWHIETTPFVNSLPALDEINEMCKVYPSLSKAYENFKTVYAMVEQDWKGKKE